MRIFLSVALDCVLNQTAMVRDILTNLCLNNSQNAESASNLGMARIVTGRHYFQVRLYLSALLTLCPSIRLSVCQSVSVSFFPSLCLCLSVHYNPTNFILPGHEAAYKVHDFLEKHF